MVQRLSLSVIGRMFFLGAFIGFLTIVAGGLQDIASAQSTQTQDLDDTYITIKLDSVSSLRATAQKYLDDPDLWPVILRLNGFEDITQLSKGQELRLPASQLKTAISALETSLSVIQNANEAGAHLFAPALISGAIKLRDQALTEKNNGTYATSISLSARSIDQAASAHATSEDKRDIEAEARLSDRQGWVEGQKSEENSWSERTLNAILNEQEKLRTLSSSSAQVIFRDASRLRLNPNSQAVIQRMRADPLKRRDEAKISLVEGDFYALLATESSRNRLEVNLPNADATIDSGSFWVSQDTDGAKFSNYDNKPVSIEAAGETLVLGRNEGAVVRPGQAPAAKVAVHGRIALDYPKDDAIVFNKQINLGWEAAADNEKYWLEIAHDSRFDRMADSLWGLEDNKAGDLQLAPGTYYWRVAAIDGFGLPGQMSTVRKFQVRTDNAPPFLQIRTPVTNAVIRDASITISGDTEVGASVLVEGAMAQVDQNGRFHYTFDADEGAYDVPVTARDAAGNETVRTISFVYIKDRPRDIIYDEANVRDVFDRFLTATDILTLSGTTAAEAKVSILDADGSTRSESYADADGHFSINIPMTRKEDVLTIRTTSISGYAYEENLDVLIIDEPPQIIYARQLPAVTSSQELEILVETDPGTQISINGEDVTTDGTIAHRTLILDEGPNLIETVATNAVGLVTIDKRTVLFDTQIPEVTDQEITVENADGRERLFLRIGARDPSGLAKTSRFIIRNGDQENHGVMRYNRVRKAYQGNAEIPLSNADQPLLIEIEIADVAGNVNLLKLEK